MHERELILRVLHRLLAATIALLVTINARPAGAVESEWKQVASEDEVTAWTQETGSGLPIARATTIVDAPLCEIVAVIRDINRHCEWSADCVTARTVRRHDWARIDMYLRIKGYPLVGVADRDAVLGTTTVVDRSGESAEITFSIVATEPGALAHDTVHMPKLTGSYRVSRRADGKSQVDYQFAADLGGWVPGWVGTRTVEQLPWRTLVGLRQHAVRAGAGYRDEIGSWPRIDDKPLCSSP